MPLSVVDLYRDILPKTNCGDCGYPTCMAFASMVVSEKLPLSNCPHLTAEVVERCRPELEKQYAEGKWLKRDMAQDALAWAREKASSMKLEDFPGRIGGRLLSVGGGVVLELPYFTGAVLISPDEIKHRGGVELTRWEQVFLFNHMAQGGSTVPTGKWKGLVEFPNTVSKMKSMAAHVEAPLIECFGGRRDALMAAAGKIGGEDCTGEYPSADLAISFLPLPRVPVMLVYWGGEAEEKLETQIKLLFDETITDHLDIESIMFLSERLRQLLCDAQ